MAPGRTFKGWWIKNADGTYTKTALKQQFSTKVNKNITLVANTDFYIDLDLNGGEGLDTRIVYDMSSDPITIGTPTKNGHTFKGWEDSSGNLITDTITIPKYSSGDRKYKAQWEAETYKVTIIL